MKVIAGCYWIALFLGIFQFAFGQTNQSITSPVSWNFTSEKISDTQYKILFYATIAEGWHLYSQDIEGFEGPLPTLYNLEEGAEFSLVGSVVESTPIVKKEPVFNNMELSFFEGTATMYQLIELTDSVLPKISGNINFMVCDDEECMPPTDQQFVIDLATGLWTDPSIVADDQKVSDQEEISEVIPNPRNLDRNNPINECGDVETKNNDSYWGLFFFGLIFGFLAIFTPCVFPMIPLTVSFFTKGGQQKGKGTVKALIYGASIVFVYVILSGPFYLPGTDPEMLNRVATGGTLNIIFFVIFVAFAISFFGYYELTLPSSWANKADAAADKKGGILGTIFLAFVLAIVSFSCTGPLLGAVLGESLSKGPVPITMAMLGFGLGLGLPFAVFAMFPAIMKSMPQSGGWLNTVKVVLGFVELALAVKFLSTADSVYKLHFIERETFYLIWIIIAVLTSAYLFDLFRFPHDVKGAKKSATRLVFGFGFLIFGLYLVPGVMPPAKQWWNTSLIAGFPPPADGYSWYSEEVSHFTSYEEALAYAQENDKNLLIDFTGWGCVNCRKMEENVWPNEKVAKLMEKYVIVSLYVDDKTDLPEEEQGEITIELYDGTKKKKQIKTTGDKWATFESLRFQKISQPYYVLMSPDEYLLTNPVGYTPNVDDYASWLECGLDASDKLKSGSIDLSQIDTTSSGANVMEIEMDYHVDWEYAVELRSDSIIELTINGTIDEGWHTYSQFLTGFDGPLPTMITFEESDDFELVGDIVEENTHTYFDSVWDCEIIEFTDNAIFKASLKRASMEAFTLNGTISFMVCENGQCLPPTDQTFEIKIVE